MNLHLLFTFIIIELTLYQVSRVLGIYLHVKEAHISNMVSKAEDSSVCGIQLRVDDMECQLAPGDYVIAHARGDWFKLL